METKTKMTTREKAEELVDDLGVSHAIYITEEVIVILKDWEGTELAQKDWLEIKEIVESVPLPYSVDEDISCDDIKLEENELKVKITDKLPDGVLWEKSKDYSKQFAIRDKPVQSEIAMNEAQDHYYRGMIALRDMIVQNDEAVEMLDGLGVVLEKKSLKDSLWLFLRNEHNLILLDSEVFEIIHLIDKFRSENSKIKKQLDCNCEELVKNKELCPIHDKEQFDNLQNKLSDVFAKLSSENGS